MSETGSSGPRRRLKPTIRNAIAVVAPTCIERNVSSGSERPRTSGVNSTAVSAIAMTPRKSFACGAGREKVCVPFI
jgi:hypothetical protein